MAVQEIVVPDIGGAEGAEVIELLVAVGDTVAVDQGLILLESDKASMEIPSTAAGTVVELLVAEGDQLSEGAPIAKLEIAGAEGGLESTEAIEPREKPEAEGSSEAAPQATPHATPQATQVASQAAAPEVTNEQEPRQQAEPVTEVAPESDSTPLAVPAADAPPPTIDEPAVSAVYAGPAVRKLARELGVQLTQVTGTGPQDRILKEDVHQFVQRALREPAAAAGGGAGIPAVPETDFGKFGEVEVTQRSKLDKLTANNMHRSWLNVPHVTQFDEADISELEEFRAGLKAEAEARGTKLTPLPFLFKACAVALRDHPQLNSSLARGGEDLVYKKYIHIGMAVDTPAGLMVPVIRDVDKKTIWALAAEILEMAGKARDRKLMPADMQGGCFTISSLGNIGGTGFTPIVNTPEVGILGVSKAALKPVWDGANFTPRTLLPLALSYDHRVVNGGDGGRFLSQLVILLSDIRKLCM